MKPLDMEIVLVDPKYPMNIGNVTRTMACVGYKKLTLVRPCSDWNSLDSVKFSLFGKDILDNAKVFERIPEIKNKNSILFGFSRRIGRRRSYPLTLNELWDFVEKFGANKKIKFVFGGESAGLSTEDLALCDHIVTIDKAIIGNSLSLPTAVAMVLYEFKKACVFFNKNVPPKPDGFDIGQAGVLNDKVRELLKKSGFIDNRDSKRVMAKIKEIIKKLSTSEIRLLHSILNNLEK